VRRWLTIRMAVIVVVAVVEDNDDPVVDIMIAGGVKDGVSVGKYDVILTAGTCGLFAVDTSVIAGVVTCLYNTDMYDADGVGGCNNRTSILLTAGVTMSGSVRVAVVGNVVLVAVVDDVVPVVVVDDVVPVVVVLVVTGDGICMRGSRSESESSGSEYDLANDRPLLLRWFSCAVFCFLRLLLSLSLPPFGVLYVIVVRVNVSG
jgi:hypothetical protein